MTHSQDRIATRPKSVVLVAGTGTEVGKTWVTSRLITELRTQQVIVQARKPAQSFETEDVTTDADQLAQASGEDPRSVCPEHRCYQVAMAPPMAADALGRTAITITDLAAEIAGSWNSTLPATGPAQIGFVESAGGPWSPIAHDGDCLDLARLLAPEAIILVADAGLGTINAVRPAVRELKTIAPVLLTLNRFDPTNELHERNKAWLEQYYGIDSSTSVALLSAQLLALLAAEGLPDSHM